MSLKQSKGTMVWK